MLGTICIFCAGLITGIAATYYNHRCMTMAAEAERKRAGAHIAKAEAETRRLREELDIYMRQQECSGAYHKGFERGQRSPRSDAERFAETFEGRTVRFANTTRKDA